MVRQTAQAAHPPSPVHAQLGPGPGGARPGPGGPTLNPTLGPIREGCQCSAACQVHPQRPPASAQLTPQGEQGPAYTALARLRRPHVILCIQPDGRLAAGHVLGGCQLGAWVLHIHKKVCGRSATCTGPPTAHAAA